jgi:hypothetical protein
MSNEKEQTAVESYIEKLLDLDYEYAKGLITLAVWSERKKSLIEQAKQMNKQQMCKFAYKCHNHYKVYGDFNIEQYYEQTYGGNK